MSSTQQTCYCSSEAIARYEADLLQLEADNRLAYANARMEALQINRTANGRQRSINGTARGTTGHPDHAAQDMINGPLNEPQPWEQTGLGSSHQRVYHPAPCIPGPASNNEYYSAPSVSPSESAVFRSMGRATGPIDHVDRLDNVVGAAYHHQGPYDAAAFSAAYVPPRTAAVPEEERNLLDEVDNGSSDGSLNNVRVDRGFFANLKRRLGFGSKAHN